MAHTQFQPMAPIADFSLQDNVGGEWGVSFGLGSAKVNTGSYSAVDPSVVGVSPLTERQRIEMQEEQNLKDSTTFELWMRWWTTVAMEGIATLMYVTVALTALSLGGGLLTIGLAEGFMMRFVVTVFTRENAGHIDPVLSTILMLSGKLALPWYFLGAYWTAQLCATIIATLFTWAMTAGFDRTLGLGTDVLAFGYTPGQGLCAILLGCWVLYTAYLWLLGSDGVRNFFEQAHGGKFHGVGQFVDGVSGAHIGVALSVGQIAGTRFNALIYYCSCLISNTCDSSNWWLWGVGSLAAGAFALGTFWFPHWLDRMAYRPAYKRFESETVYPVTSRSSFKSE